MLHLTSKLGLSAETTTTLQGVDRLVLKTWWTTARAPWLKKKHSTHQVSAVVGSLGGDHDARREMDKSEEVPRPMMYRR